LAAKSNSLNEALLALRNALKAAYRLAPAVVVISILLAALIAYVSLSFIEIIQGFIIILIIFISILVYYKSNNYGEAGLALMAGLMAAFTVTWTWNKSLVFMVALLGFLLLILLIGCLKIAGKEEHIYLSAAIYIDVDRAKEIAKRLKEIAHDTPTIKMGPIEKANAIKIMASRKISIESMNDMLKTIDLVSRITNLNAEYVTSFLIALSKVFIITPGSDLTSEIDKIVVFCRNAPISHEEFIYAFMNSKRLVISGEVDPSTYHLLLKDSLKHGVEPEDTFGFIRNGINKL